MFERAEELKKLWDEYVSNDKDKIGNLLERIRQSGDEKFIKLFNGNLQIDYPSQSEADLALCNKLAFWTSKDGGLMDLVFRSSALIRPKWDEAHFSDGRSYGADVIAKAIAGCRDVYSASNSSAYTPKKINSNEVADAIIEKRRLINFADTYYEYQSGCYRSRFI